MGRRPPLSSLERYLHGKRDLQSGRAVRTFAHIQERVGMNARQITEAVEGSSRLSLTVLGGDRAVEYRGE